MRSSYIKDKIKRKRFFVSLLILILLHLSNNYFWLKEDKVIVSDDPFWRHIFSVEFYRFLKEGTFFQHPIKYIKVLAERTHKHGFFVQLLTAPFYFIFGESQDAGAMVNCSIFLSILILSVYGITKEISEKRVALLASFIISMYPIIFNQSRMYLLDLPLTALVTLSIYFLIKSDHLRDRRYTLLFSISLFFGVFIKINFILFIFIPLMITIGKIVIRHKSKYRWRNLIVILSLSMGSFFLFYMIKGRKMFVWIYEAVIVNCWSMISLKGLSSFLSYHFPKLAQTINDGLSFFFTFIFLMSLYFFIISRLKYRFYLLSSLFSPFIFLFVSTSIVHFARYTMPVFPLVAIISSIGISRMPKIFRRIVISIIVIFSILQFYAISWGVKALPQNISIGKGNSRIFLFRQYMHVPPPRNRWSHPTRDYWDCKQLWEAIKREIKNKGGNTIVAVLYTTPEVFYPLYYYAFIEKASVKIITIDMEYDLNYRRGYSLAEVIPYADYVVEIRKPIPPWFRQPWFIENEREEAENSFQNNIGKFKFIKKFNLPPKGVVVLYKNLEIIN